jgi:hypothetical protein
MGGLRTWRSRPSLKSQSRALLSAELVSRTVWSESIEIAEILPVCIVFCIMSTGSVAIWQK